MTEPSCICLDCETRLERLQPCTSCGSYRVDLWSPSWDAYPEYRGSYYDREGNQLTLLEYALKFGSDEARQEYKFVDRTDIGDFAYVSTVWLGVNHRIGPGRPLIFESMAFLHTLLGGGGPAPRCRRAPRPAATPPKQRHELAIG